MITTGLGGQLAAVRGRDGLSKVAKGIPRHNGQRPRGDESILSCQGSETSFACRKANHPVRASAPSQRELFKTFEQPAEHVATPGTRWRRRHDIRAAGERSPALNDEASWQYREHVTTTQPLTLLLS